MADCYIFGAGPFFGLAASPSSDDLLLAADGGYQHCLSAGLRPHLLLGDFDSLDQIPPDIPTQAFPVEKDDPDLMLAVYEGLARGFRTFHLYGGTGGRMDHTIGNLQILGFLARERARAYLYDEGYVFTAIAEGTITLPARSEGIFSVFCLGEEAHGVTIRGGQYPLENGSLSPIRPLGVSNHFQGNEVTISVKQGCLLIGWELP